MDYSPVFSPFDILLIFFRLKIVSHNNCIQLWNRLAFVVVISLFVIVIGCHAIFKISPFQLLLLTKNSVSLVIYLLFCLRKDSWREALTQLNQTLSLEEKRKLKKAGVWCIFI